MAKSAYYRLYTPKRMTIDYLSHPESIQTRRITLYGVYIDGSTVSLQAWCSLARARRLFEAQHIVGMLDDTGRPIAPIDMVATLIAGIADGTLHEVLHDEAVVQPDRIARLIARLSGSARQTGPEVC